MRFEASPGHVLLKLYREPKQSKILMPDNVQIDECPTFEIVNVGAPRLLECGKREEIPYKAGDRVVVAAGRVMPITNGTEKFAIVDWKLIFAQAFTDRE